LSTLGLRLFTVSVGAGRGVDVGVTAADGIEAAEVPPVLVAVAVNV